MPNKLSNRRRQHGAANSSLQISPESSASRDADTEGPSLHKKPPRNGSIKSFCEEIGISVATFYRNIEDMPRSIKIGSVRRILLEDRLAWKKRKQCQADKEVNGE